MFAFVFADGNWLEWIEVSFRGRMLIESETGVRVLVDYNEIISVTSTKVLFRGVKKVASNSMDYGNNKITLEEKCLPYLFRLFMIFIQPIFFLFSSEHMDRCGRRRADEFWFA